eukprot:2772539-Rhodomonas_salina.1
MKKQNVDISCACGDCSHFPWAIVCTSTFPFSAAHPTPLGPDPQPSSTPLGLGMWTLSPTLRGRCKMPRTNAIYGGARDYEFPQPVPPDPARSGLSGLNVDGSTIESRSVLNAHSAALLFFRLTPWTSYSAALLFFFR